MFLFSVVMGIIFCMVEMRDPDPILPLSFFQNRIVSVSLAVTFFTGFGMFGAIIFIPLYFQGVLGLSATASGSFLTPSPRSTSRSAMAGPSRRRIVIAPFLYDASFASFENPL
jgi:hypothetical protein